MASITLVSTFLMGVLLLALVVGLRSGRRWESPVPTLGGGEVVDQAVRTPTAWIVGFLALIVLFGGGAVLAVSDGTVLPSVGDVTVLFGLGLTTLLGLFLVAGIYAAMLERGRGRAMAVTVAAFILGLLFVLGVTVNLIFGA